MMKSLRVLMVDDHPLMLDVYKNALQLIEKKLDYKPSIITQASTCDDAIAILQSTLHRKSFDIVILDIGLPASQ